MKRRTRKITAVITAVLTTVSLYTPAVSTESKAESVRPGNPLIDSNGITTWDTVYFGSYWQNDTNKDGVADERDEKEPIRWRVLSVNGNDAFLLADRNLDDQPYQFYDWDSASDDTWDESEGEDEPWDDTEGTGATWSDCRLRSWLNKDFLNAAFSENEKNAILDTTVINGRNPEYGEQDEENTKDKVYLLSIEEASNRVYGFQSSFSEESETREVQNTDYISKGKAFTDKSIRYNGNGRWWLRSPGSGSDKAAFVDYDGIGSAEGDDKVISGLAAVRPVLHLNLASVDCWTPGEPVTSHDGHELPQMTFLPSDSGLANPVRGKDTIVYDSIYFGNYWQSDTNGDGTADEMDEKEPIRWRVLSVNGDDAFLMADQNLDGQPYNNELADVTWETCTLRGWLNDTFLKTAFTEEEQKLIRKTTIENPDGVYGADGGIDTEDRVYLLSLAESTNPFFGFNRKFWDKDRAREAENTAYAEYKGVATVDVVYDGTVDENGEWNTTDQYAGNGYWWTRSPGLAGSGASYLWFAGGGDYKGGPMDFSYGIRPVLHLKASADTAACWTMGEKITCTEKDTDEPKPTGNTKPIETSQATETESPTATQNAPETPEPSATPEWTEMPQESQTPHESVDPISTEEPGIADQQQTALPSTAPVIDGQKAGETRGEKQLVSAPARPIIKSVKNQKGRKVKLTLKKKVSGAVGYQVQYARKKSFKNVSSIITKKRTVTIKKLKKKKTYYFRVHAYALDGSRKIYGEWSKVKKVKVKK